MLANKTNDNRTYQPCREGKGSCKTLTATAAALKGWGGHVAAPLAEDSDFSLCQSKIRILQSALRVGPPVTTDKR